MAVLQPSALWAAAFPIGIGENRPPCFPLGWRHQAGTRPRGNSTPVIQYYSHREEFENNNYCVRRRVPLCIPDDYCEGTPFNIYKRPTRGMRACCAAEPRRRHDNENARTVTVSCFVRGRSRSVNKNIRLLVRNTA